MPAALHGSFGEWTAVGFFICGSALRGQPDHGNLLDAAFVGAAETAPRYRALNQQTWCAGRPARNTE
jgi:hypothetical protein